MLDSSTPQRRPVYAEPALHFVILAASLFGLFALVGEVEPDPSTLQGREIEIDDTLLSGLRANFLRRHGRLPNEDELEGAIAQYVREEVLYREALALGLDRGDAIVRRRLIQKMEFLTEDNQPIVEPSESALQTWLADHTDRYRRPATLSLRHVFIARNRSQNDTATDGTGTATATLSADDVARDLGIRLQAGEDAETLGGPFLHGSSFNNRSSPALERTFGDAFTRAVLDLPTEQWVGPVTSSYGLHWVFIQSRRPEHDAELDEVRDAVRRDLRQDLRQQENVRAFAALTARYRVIRRDSGP